MYCKHQFLIDSWLGFVPSQGNRLVFETIAIALFVTDSVHKPLFVIEIGKIIPGMSAATFLSGQGGLGRNLSQIKQASQFPRL